MIVKDKELYAAVADMYPTLTAGRSTSVSLRTDGYGAGQREAAKIQIRTAVRSGQPSYGGQLR